MLSKGILVIAVIFSILYPLIDVNFHSHFSDALLQKKVVQLLAKDKIDQANEITVLVNKRWVTLEGTLPDNQDSRYISRRIAAEVAGVKGVSNMLNELNIPLLEKFKVHAKNNPEIMDFNYNVSNDRTVTLTGHCEKESVKKEIGEIVTTMKGVKTVVNNISTGPLAQRIEEMIIQTLRLQNIYFDFNTAIIRKESQPSLDRIAELFKKYPNTTCTIEGHTDNIGTVEYNQKLSEARAKSVLNALVERGIVTSRLTAVGYGKTRPVSQNTTPETRAENRRIEFKVKLVK